jgi:hypothetical protein
MPPSVNLFFILGESILTVGLLSSHLLLWGILSEVLILLALS